MKYLIPLIHFVGSCLADTYPPNLADYVVSSEPNRFKQDVGYIRYVTACSNIIWLSMCLNQKQWIENFITANLEKYKKSIFEIIPQAVAKCVLKIDEFSNISNNIVKFAGVNEENFTQAEVNAVVLYNWIYQLMKDKNDTTKITIDKLAEHIGNKTKINQAKLQKAISDIKEYDKVLRFTNMMNICKRKRAQLISIFSEDPYKKTYDLKYCTFISRLNDVNKKLETFADLSYTTNSIIHVQMGQHTSVSFMFEDEAFSKFFQRKITTQYSNNTPYKLNKDSIEFKIYKSIDLIYDGEENDFVYILDCNMNPINKNNNIFDSDGNIKVPLCVVMQQQPYKNGEKCLNYRITEIIINNDEYSDKKYDRYRSGGKVNLELIIPKYAHIKTAKENRETITLQFAPNTKIKLQQSECGQTQESNVALGIKLGDIRHKMDIDQINKREYFPSFCENDILTYIDLTDVNFTNVKSIRGLARNNHNLTYIKGFDHRSSTKNICDMSDAFKGTKLRTLDLSTNNLSSVENMSSLCEDCTELEQFALPDEEKAAPQKLIRMDKSFKNCINIKTIYFGSSSIKRGVETDMTSICEGDKSLEKFTYEFYRNNNSAFKPIKIQRAFAGCKKLKYMRLAAQYKIGDNIYDADKTNEPKQNMYVNLVKNYQLELQARYFIPGYIDKKFEDLEWEGTNTELKNYIQWQTINEHKEYEK